MTNIQLPFEIEIDALGYGLRVVLMQQDKTLSFLSQVVSDMLGENVEVEIQSRWGEYTLIKKFNRFFKNRIFEVFQKCVRKV